MPESGTEAPDRIADRRARAISGARAAIRALARQGVSARVTGSLATGRFRSGSDIDLLVTDCPPALKYAIESLVEDCLGGLPFDVIYLDELPAAKRAHFLGIAVDASDLR
jgi:predicted nucleotidyltransferase